MTDALTDFILNGSGCGKRDISELSNLATIAAECYVRNKTPLSEKIAELVREKGLSDNEATIVCQMANRKTGSYLTELHGNKKGNIEFPLAIPLDVIGRVSEARPSKPPLTSAPASRREKLASRYVPKSRDRVLDDIGYFEMFGLREDELALPSEVTKEEKFMADREVMDEVHTTVSTIDQYATEYNILREKMASDIGALLAEGESPKIVSLVLKDAGVPVDTIKSLLNTNKDVLDWDVDPKIPKYAHVEIDTTSDLYMSGAKLAELDRLVSVGLEKVASVNLPYGSEPFGDDLKKIKSIYTR